MTVGQFIEAMEEKAGPISIKTGMSKNRKVKLKEAVFLLVKADEYLHGVTVSEETVSFVWENRIADIDSVPEKYRECLAKAYVLGFVKGTADCDFSDKRVFKMKTRYSASTYNKMIARLTDTSKRYKLSPDLKTLRTGKNMPKLAKYYEYVLDSYPNSYYDTVFNFMTVQAEPGDAVFTENWQKNGCDVYKGRMIWDTALEKLSYEDRFRAAAGIAQSGRMEMYSAFMYPSEYDTFASERAEETGYLGMPENPETKCEMAFSAEEFLMNALNIDYRTVSKDDVWKEYMLKNGVSEEDLENYIKECIKDELIIECDMTAADTSGIYYDHTPFTYKGCEGVVRTYAHFRIVSDNGKGFADGELVVPCGSGRQCLRNTVISDDGYSYVTEPCEEWQDGYFDVGTDAAGNVCAATIDTVRYRGIFIGLFGYPCETPSYYPGTLTIDGILALRLRNMTREEYLEKWGYLY